MPRTQPSSTSHGPASILLYTLAALVVSALFLFALTRFHDDLTHPRIERLDRAILEGIHRHDTPALTALARILSFVGSPILLFPAIPIAAGILWLRRQHRDAAIILLSMAGAGTLESLIKLHFRRVRPDLPWVFVHEHSFSFPSGHSVLAIVLYGVLAYLSVGHLHTVARRTLLLAGCLTLILTIGLSRIYLGAHYPSDVLAGYFVGATWLLFVLAAVRRSAAPYRSPPSAQSSSGSARPAAAPERT